MIRILGRRWCLLLTLCLTTIGKAFANEYFSAGFTLGSEYSDNANKSEIERISERQDRYSLQFAADYDNSLLEAGAAYRARERRFTENSQPNRSTLEGDLELLVGKPHHVADIRFTHSRRTILGSPDQVDLLANNDERDIFTLVPRARLRLTSRDELALEGQLRRIHYRYDDRRNSDRVGASLIWLHGISAVDDLEVEVTNTEVSFDEFPGFDYTYQAAQASYIVSLRNLSYRLTAGANRAERDAGPEFSRPLLGFEAEYDAGANQLSLNLRQYITDSSFGGGNDMAWTRLDVDGDTVPRLDQLERFDADARWDYAGLCTRCNLFLEGNFRSDDYRNLAEDTDEVGGGFGLEYLLSITAQVSASFNHRNRTFEAGSERTDYDLQRSRLGYRYQLTNDLSLQLHLLYEDRSSDDDTFTYHETRGGLAINYTFL